MKRLEHKTHSLAAHDGEGIVGDRAEVDAVHGDRSAIRALESGDQIQHRGFADAGFADDRDELAAFDRKGDRFKHAPGARSGKSLCEIGNRDHRAEAT